MLLLTGATGNIGSPPAPPLLEQGEDVRCLVRDPRRLGARRVDVQIALGDLGDLSDRHTMRQSLRGVDTVVHLAASIRDQPPRRLEELNGLATVRLLEAGERAGVRRFVFFSALDTGAAQRTRFFRAKWVAERAVESSPLETSVFAPPIVYDRDDPWIHLLRRFSLPPGRPGSGEGRASFQPIWSEDVARCVDEALAGEKLAPRYELAGPETMTYDEMSDLVSRLAGRARPLVDVPLPAVKGHLVGLRAVFG